MNRHEGKNSISNMESESNESDINIERIQESLGFSEADLIGRATLELGAGSATLARYYENNNDVNITSLDLEDDQLKGVKNAVQADAMKLPFKDESFDFILELGGPSGLGGSLDNTTTILKEMKRVLRSDGEIRIGRGYLSPTILEDPGDNLSLEDRKRHFREQSKKLIESIGFNVEEVDTGDGVYDFYYRIIKKPESE